MQVEPLKKFRVQLSYLHIKHPFSIVEYAPDAETARVQAQTKNPYARIEGPGAAVEVKV